MTTGALPTTRCLILSGTGVYADAWHDFPATSRRLAEVLAGVGGVEISEDLPGRVSDLQDVDVLVVNAAAGPSGDHGDDVRRGLEAFLARGGGVLAMHTGISSALLDLPDRPGITGARWVDGRSMHPPLGPCRIDVVAPSSPIVAGLPFVDVIDERYSYLELEPGNDVLCSHVLEGVAHPIVWTRSVGSARVLSDALGHGPESYDSEQHRTLLERAALWLARADSAMTGPSPADESRDASATSSGGR